MPTFGLNGAVNTTEYARLAGLYGADYGVVGAGDWQVTPVAGADRTVRIAAGTGYGRGVLDEDTPETTIAGTLVGSGTRWDTVVRRRVWGDPGVSEFAIRPGTSTKAISAARLTNPGIEDDQPIALVQFSSSNPMPVQIVDLRCWHGNAGLVAASTEALAYLDRLGSRVYVRDLGVEYVRSLDAQSNPSWAMTAGQGTRLQTASATGATLPAAGGALGITSSVSVAAVPYAREVELSFGGLATALGSGNLDVAVRRGTTELRRARVSGQNISAAGSVTDLLPAGQSASYQVVATSSGSATITSDSRFTYLTVRSAWTADA